ncbi:hypothetical protein ED312_08480 [Sinomicrobium pectinilyticum]|uniref:Uncharacterized protein n=1 Tax=Sinomicrobium pectinilyticum TaxID=1084421 RepID=A0A3N0EL01_SINP1|nr:hypothetical protein [Sinomicrobium pectinilyticum]RNL88474.1 hypothetical protein ED312_08480 [Sinomicrobium pectinilyticum]
MEEHEKKPEEKALERRLAGNLPTLDIAGDIFLIDLEKKCLCPKNPLAPGDISFARLQGYFSWTEDKYIFTYNSTQHGPQDIDFSDLYHIPESIHLVEFPSMERLDPVGYAREHGYDIRSFVEKVGIQSHFKANTIPVRESLSRLLAEKRECPKEQRQNQTRRQKVKRRGRGR